MSLTLLLLHLIRLFDSSVDEDVLRKGKMYCRKLTIYYKSLQTLSLFK
jgi:hypothetical protein